MWRIPILGGSIFKNRDAVKIGAFYKNAQIRVDKVVYILLKKKTLCRPSSYSIWWVRQTIRARTSHTVTEDRNSTYKRKQTISVVRGCRKKDSVCSGIVTGDSLYIMTTESQVEEGVNNRIKTLGRPGLRLTWWRIFHAPHPFRARWHLRKYMMNQLFLVLIEN